MSHEKFPKAPRLPWVWPNKVGTSPKFVASRAELHSALQERDVTASIYEERSINPRMKELLMKHIRHLTRVYAYKGDTDKNLATTDATLKQALRDELLRKLPYEGADLTECAAVAEFLAEDLSDLFSNFPGYKVRWVSMRTGGGSINWHPDSVRFFNQELVVSRTYAGKSTIYKGKKFDIIPRDGSTAVHRLFTIHSSPKSEYYSRVTAIAHLVK